MKRCTRTGSSADFISLKPSSRTPVPQSRTINVPSEARTSTHDVLPPNRAVFGPGDAIDPRVPQNLTYTTSSRVDEFADSSIVLHFSHPRSNVSQAVGFSD